MPSNLIEKSDIKVCRACGNFDVSAFDYDHILFRAKGKAWTNYYCAQCCAISHYRSDKQYQDYVDSYRLPPQYDVTAKPPLDPWCQVTFDRGLQLNVLLKDTKCSMTGETVDIGGYNGFLSLALLQEHDTNITVADFDQNGLRIAKAFGLNVVNLQETEIDFQSFNNYLLVHVLEHLENPSEMIRNISNAMGEDSLLYIEVPNIHGFPFEDPAHLTSFSMQALHRLASRQQLEIIRSGYTSSPDSALKYDYFYKNPAEVIYLLCRKSGAIVDDMHATIEADELVRKLNTSFTKIALKDMAPRVFKEAIRYLRLSAIFFFASLISRCGMRSMILLIRDKCNPRQGAESCNEKK